MMSHNVSKRSENLPCNWHMKFVLITNHRKNDVQQVSRACVHREIVTVKRTSAKSNWLFEKVMCILTKIYSERCTICSSESVDSSLTHRLGADLPREKLGATAAMRCEEKQSAVRFHVPEAGINECCFVFSLYVPLSLSVSCPTRCESTQTKFALHTTAVR